MMNSLDLPLRYWAEERFLIRQKLCVSCRKQQQIIKFKAWRRLHWREPRLLLIGSIFLPKSEYLQSSRLIAFLQLGHPASFPRQL